MPDFKVFGKTIKTTDQDHQFMGTDVGLIEKHGTLKPGDVFVDGGFGPGTWTLAALAVGAQTFSFDPKALAVDILNRQIELNGFTGAKVIQGGLWSESGRRLFGSNSFFEGRGGTPVDVTSLDDFFRKHLVERLDLINLDVEWAELEVLVGARETIARFRPKLIIEIHEPCQVPDITKEIDRAGRHLFEQEGSFLIAVPA
jgi:FkbM family methyltransferase